MADLITDVSPDMPFGAQTGGQNTGGRIVTVVADPQQRLRLYAASYVSGVWSTGDGGHNWRQVSRGLATGNSCAAQPVLAIDPRNRRRLLYSTFEDFRPGNPQAGLYLSTDAAGTWTRVPLSVTLDKGHGTVGFAVGQDGSDHPWVLTAQGLLIADTTATTFTSSSQWKLVPGPTTTFGSPGVVPTHVVSDGEALIACFGNTVYRCPVDNLIDSSGEISAPWVGSGGLPSDFSGRALSLAPVPSGARHPVLVLGTTGSGDAQVLEVWSVDVGVSTALRVGTVDHVGGSGTFVVAAPRQFRTDGSYDVIVGDGLDFYSGVVADAGRSPQVTGSFEVISHVHRDPWSVAFPVDYATAVDDPPIYLAHDGGVSVRQDGEWVAAMHGLHAYKSANMAGVTVGNADALYVPSGDNDLWASRDGGATWEAMGDMLGDAGAAYLDPRVPGQVAASRNGTAAVYRSTMPTSAPPGGGDPRYYLMRDGRSGSFFGLSPEGGTEPPQIPGLVQVMTLHTDDGPISDGDFLVVRNDTEPTGDAQILRSTRSRKVAGGGTERIWRAVTDRQHTTPRFVRHAILAIAATGGHDRLRLYVLLAGAGGTILARGDIDSRTGMFTRFVRCSGDAQRRQPTRPKTLHADPYHRDVVYVWDDPDGGPSTIRSSENGGDTWREEPQLKARATNNGEFSFRFQRGAGDVRCGPLQSMVFSPADPDFRLAVTFPGGLAFTRNGGDDWYDVGDDLQGVGPLTGVRSLRDLVAYPYSAFVTGQEGKFRLYVAMLGRGLVRIDTGLRTTKHTP